MVRRQPTIKMFDMTTKVTVEATQGLAKKLSIFYAQPASQSTSQ